jgi:hypothetical protein
MQYLRAEPPFRGRHPHQIAAIDAAQADLLKRGRQADAVRERDELVDLRGWSFFERWRAVRSRSSG